MSWLLGRLVFTADLSGIAVIHRAMAKHKSQLVWYRKLYMVFSRYILVNTYEQLMVAER
jgi:N-acetylglucosaminylphosphatidylinositol deacetylase